MAQAAKSRKSVNKPTAALAFAVVDGLARLVDFAPTEMVVFSDESDWAFVGGDFRVAMDDLIAREKAQQPALRRHLDNSRAPENPAITVGFLGFPAFGPSNRWF
jgi:hypothetical protein